MEFKAGFETVKIDGSSIGKVLEAYVKANAIETFWSWAPIITPA